MFHSGMALEELLKTTFRKVANRCRSQLKAKGGKVLAPREKTSEDSRT